MSKNKTAAHAVFANGIWKSGNHLLLKLCDMLGYPIAGSGIAASLVNGRFKVVRKLIRGPRLNQVSVNVGLEQPVNVSEKWLENHFHTVHGHTIGGHAAYSDTLLEILRRQDIRTIQIIRDPRDIALSYARWISTRRDEYWHETLNALTEEERIGQLIKGFKSKVGNFDSLATVLDRSQGWLNHPDVLVIRFEHLVGEQGGGDRAAQLKEIEKVVNWLGISNVETNIEQLASQLFGGTKTFNTGQVGKWRKVFTPAHLSDFQKVVGPARMQEWGYE